VEDRPTGMSATTGSGVRTDSAIERPPEHRRVRIGRPDPVVALCLVLLFAFPVTAVLAARSQPVDPRAEAALGEIPDGPGGKVHPVPDFTPGGAVDRSLQGRPPRLAEFDGLFAQAMAPLFDPAQRRLLMRHVRGQGSTTGPGTRTDYPYRYANLSDLVEAAIPAKPSAAEADAAADLGGVLLLYIAAGRTEAGWAAFAVLDRARGGGACRPQLMLALLLAGSLGSQRYAGGEFARAEDACPDDPTALWLRGQWESLAAFDGQLGDGRVSARAAPATFRRLQRRFPRSSGGWSGMADVELRLAYDAAALLQPFTARRHFERALAAYRRARRLDRDPRLGAGEARALAGTGQYAEAARIQAATAAATGNRGVVQAWLTELLERARRWGPAVDSADALAARRREAPGTGLYMTARDPLTHLAEQDAMRPMSEQVGRTRGYYVEIRPISPPAAVLPSSAVEDISFIPSFRERLGVTGYGRWCPAWSRLRDLVLAGRADEALAAMPERPPACGGSKRLLAAVSHAEAGDDAAALALIGDGTRAERIDRLYEVRQDLWRFAGDYGRAAAINARWARLRPASPVPADRSGEVAFLAQRFDDAAVAFGREVRLRRASTSGWSAGEALALVKRGLVLARARRDREALAAFASADEVALRSLAAHSGGADAARDAAYYARAQTGDLLLRAHRYDDAAEQYAAAREIQPGVSGGRARRIEVLDSNQSIVQTYLGRSAEGLRLARQAVAADPLSPLFLENEGFALARAGRLDDAADAYRAAVRSDSSLYPAWNALGVTLSRLGRRDEAADAFRRAVGVRRGYAEGWFNLGVTLERQGLTHAAAAQGALAQAFRHDGSLRDRERELIADDRVYFTTLDLSKPLPPRWDFAESQDELAIPATGLAVLLLLGLQLGRSAAGRGLAGGTARWLAAARALLSKLPRAAASFSPSALAVLVTLAVFLVPAARGSEGSRTAVVVFGVGLLALVVLIMRARVLAARRTGVRLRQRGWRPALLVGCVSAFAGIPWAPLPVAEPDAPAPAVHRIGPITAALAGLALLALSMLFDVPVARSLGVASVVMAASMLTPVEPLDGARMQGGSAAVTAGLALAGTAGLALLGLE